MARTAVASLAVALLACRTEEQCVGVSHADGEHVTCPSALEIQDQGLLFPKHPTCPEGDLISVVLSSREETTFQGEPELECCYVAKYYTEHPNTRAMCR